jgi:Transglycosylase SLT domain
MTTARLRILGAVLSVALCIAWQPPPRATMAAGAARTLTPVTWNDVVPVAPQILRPGVLPHPTGRRHGASIKVFLAHGRDRVLQTNGPPVPTVRRRRHRPAGRPHPGRTPAPPVWRRSRRLPHLAHRASSPPVRVAPAPTCAVVECDPLTAIHWAAARWGASEPALVAVAQCESSLSPQAYNAGGGYSGLFQFLPSTYWAYARQTGETRSYWSASGSADVAAWMFAHGLANQWGCA